MNLKNKTVAVTGGAGFVGSHLVDRLITKEPKKIIVISNFFLGKEDNLLDAKSKFDVEIVKADVSNLYELGEAMNKQKVEAVFNLAVIPLPTSLTQPDWTFRQNVEMTLNLCEMQRHGWFETLLQFSSSEAYGSTIISPMKEDHPVNPTTPYGASKLATDHIALSYNKTFGTKTSVIRPFNIYGPRQNDKKYAGLIPLTINRILNNEPLIINGDGKQTRDYTYVTDIADAAISICESDRTIGKIVNIGSGKDFSINHIVGTIAKLMNYDGAIVNKEGRLGEVSRLIADISLAKELINYSPSVDFETGLKLTIDYYKGKSWKMC
jgi:UDP-glucose 4-epimerase